MSVDGYLDNMRGVVIEAVTREMYLSRALLPDPSVLARQVSEAELALRSARKNSHPVAQETEPYAWMESARCKGLGPRDFFPPDGVGVESAQKICSQCPVKVDCLEYALLDRIKDGVWGGASERERRRILRRRRDVGGS